MIQFLIILMFLCVGDVKSWKINIHNARKAVSSIITASSCLVPLYNGHAFAADTLSPVERSAIENIDRVIYSLKYIEDDIATKSDPDSVVNQVKFLLKNYKLKENLQTTLNLIPSSSREEAREHARNAVEDLAQIFEYFQEDIDNTTGKKTASKEVLLFAQQAIGATKKELKSVTSLYPTEEMRAIDEKIRKEFTESEVDKIVPI